MSPFAASLVCVGDYVDELRLRIEGYEGGYPSQETLTDGRVVSETLGREIERGDLLTEIRAELQRDRHSYHLSERYGETSWGAAGAGLDLVVQVGAGVVATGLAAAIAAAVKRVLGRSPYGAHVYDSDAALLRAREVMAEVAACDVDDLSVERFERGGPGWVSTVRFGPHVYEVEISTDGGVTFRRTSPLG